MNALFVLIGICIGVGITLIVFRAYHVGSLRIDRSDPTDVPYMFLELSKGVGDISKKKHVVLKVNLDSYIPHE